MDFSIDEAFDWMTKFEAMVISRLKHVFVPSSVRHEKSLCLHGGSIFFESFGSKYLKSLVECQTEPRGLPQENKY